MGLDLIIGFPTQPEGLDRYLREQGFELESTEQVPHEILLSKYRLLIPKKSAQGVRLSYYHGLDQNDLQLWETIAPQSPIAAMAIARLGISHTWFDYRMHQRACADLRDRYAVLLFDPQTGRFERLSDHIHEELVMVRHAIEYRDWYASQWGPTSVAIFTHDQPEPLRIIERPEEWGDNWSWNLCDQGIDMKRTR